MPELFRFGRFWQVGVYRRQINIVQQWKRERLLSVWCVKVQINRLTVSLFVKNVKAGLFFQKKNKNKKNLINSLQNFCEWLGIKLLLSLHLHRWKKSTAIDTQTSTKEESLMFYTRRPLLKSPRRTEQEVKQILGFIFQAQLVFNSRLVSFILHRQSFMSWEAF